MPQSNPTKSKTQIRIFTEEDARFARLMAGMSFDEQHALLILMEVMSALGPDRTCIESAWLTATASEAPHLLPLVEAMVPVRRAA